SKETWNNLYRIHNFNVEKKYRRQGIGKQLFDHVIENAKKEGCRAIILEVQSCNAPAIEFYMNRGLHFVGLNTLCYTNKDIENREVRLEMGMRF
ncbi:MAG: GNAT family N-acetyltransferase, partial [Acholeplasmataceae bacterium]|nr:GNAT family N-acetyltransferase [Acholeplasmataceae bacterium]